MSGHSKWANIKHRKSQQDAAKGKIFTKLIRAITVAARHGGGDASANSTLRLAVDKALSQNMSRDTIDRAIKRGVGNEGESNMEEVTYEGYGPAGVAILVTGLSDNRNRTVAEVRHAFAKGGGNLGAEGSVAYLFSRQGVLTFEPGADENKIMEIALEAGALDVKANEDSSIDVFCAAEDFNAVRDAMTSKGINIANAEISMIPATQVALDKESGRKKYRYYQEQGYEIATNKL